MQRMDNGRNWGAKIAKGVVAGMIGGFVASWLMNRAQPVTTAVTERFSPQARAWHNQRHRFENGRFGQQRPNQERDADAPATVQTATAVYEAVFDEEPTRQWRKRAGPVVHYTFGTLTGGLYGGLAECLPVVTTCHGTLFGTAVWAGGDETALPLLGLSQPPTDIPAAIHAEAFTAHLVYGFALDTVRRLARWFLKD